MGTPIPAPPPVPIHGSFGEMSWDRWTTQTNDAIMVECPNGALSWSYRTNTDGYHISLSYTVTCK